MGVGEQHREPVDANAFARSGRHAVRQRSDIIHVHLARHFLPATFDLLAEAAFLLGGIIELRKGVAEFHPRDIDLEALDQRWIVGAAF